MIPIRSELLAAKLQSARSGEPESAAFAKQLAEKPRLLETLWFLEWAFRQPGGGPRFVGKLVEVLPERFQTEAMLKAGATDKAGQWTLEQCLPVWLDKSLKSGSRDARAILYSEDSDRPPEDLDAISFRDWLSWFIGPEVSAKDARGSDLPAKALRIGLSRFNRPFLKAECLDAAKSKLPSLFADWCELQSMTCDGVWYCSDLLKTLLDFMDAHAKQTAGELAETEVTRLVFRELDFARSQNVAVPIVGASRFGKTKSVSVWCAMRPGQARLVTVPDSNRERDFFEAHADAFGISYGPATPLSALKRLVEYVHRNGGLFLVYDEAHFLIPVSYHRATPPRRLNWVRCQVIDRDCGCAFFATPQSYRESMDAYVKKTGYCMEQWLGRLAPAVVLPDSLASADVLAVARNHFPDVPEPYLKLISARAMQSEGYLKSMEITVKRACFLAGERGCRKPDLEDVRTAIEYTMPASAPEMLTPAPRRRVTAPALQPVGRPTASLVPGVQAEPEHDFPRRNSLLKVGELEPALAG